MIMKKIPLSKIIIDFEDFLKEAYEVEENEIQSPETQPETETSEEIIEEETPIISQEEISEEIVEAISTKFKVLTFSEFIVGK